MGVWEDLAEMNDEYAAAPKAESRTFEEVPDGKYQVIVQAVEVTTSKAGNLMLKWKLQILAGPYAGRLIWKHSLLNSKEALPYLKADLAHCGVELALLTDLEGRCGELLDKTLQVTKGKSVYINGPVKLDLPPRTSAPDDIPF